MVNCAATRLLPGSLLTWHETLTSGVLKNDRSRAGAHKNVKKIVALVRRGFAALTSESRRDEGVIGLIIIIALLAAAAALIASSVRQNKDAEIRRLSANASSVKLLTNSALSFFLTDPDGAGVLVRNGLIPCPDTDSPPDGFSNGTAVCTATTGVVPWLTMGLSQDDAIDSFGNYFTYVVSGNATSRAICNSVSNSYDTTAAPQYTGTLNDVTDTEARLTTQAATQGAPFYYAFVSHGKNGFGGISRNAARSAPTSASEIQNCCT